MAVLLVTGTDAGVGKTVVTAAVAAAVGARPHRADAVANQATPTTKIFRRP